MVFIEVFSLFKCHLQSGCRAALSVILWGEHLCRNLTFRRFKLNLNFTIIKFSFIYEKFACTLKLNLINIDLNLCINDLSRAYFADNKYLCKI